MRRTEKEWGRRALSLLPGCTTKSLSLGCVYTGVLCGNTTLQGPDPKGPEGSANTFLNGCIHFCNEENASISSARAQSHAPCTRLPALGHSEETKLTQEELAECPTTPPPTIPRTVNKLSLEDING